MVIVFQHNQDRSLTLSSDGWREMEILVREPGSVVVEKGSHDTNEGVTIE